MVDIHQTSFIHNVKETNYHFWIEAPVLHTQTGVPSNKMANVMYINS